MVWVSVWMGVSGGDDGSLVAFDVAPWRRTPPVGLGARFDAAGQRPRTKLSGEKENDVLETQIL